jgi:chromosome partitioning protein
MARIVGMVQSKGGVGKTTTAVNLAAELSRRGHSVRVLDADPAAHAVQIAGMGRLRFEVAPHLLEEDQHGQAWGKAVRQAAAEFVLVDAPGAMGLAYGATVALSDIVLVPSGSTIMDVRGAADTVRFIRDFRRKHGKPDVLVVPSRIDKRTSAGREAIATLAGLTEPVGPLVSYRAVVADSFALGEPVAEGSPSAAEFAALLDAVLTRLGVAA